MSRSGVSRVGGVCVALLAVACCVALLLAAGADAAKTNPRKPMPLPEGHHRTFPTHDELKASEHLRNKYAGDNKITVHIVPHTHDDVGWLKTVDQYYLGANNSIQHAAVRYILTTVVEELQKDPNRKFIYVEQAFFQRWYKRQTADVQAATKKLVANGQLEFINGGWCMHDEAATHWIDMVDQTTLGHAFIQKEFGVTPKVGWQIDPFGHSSTQAALLSAQVGFEGLFFARIDHQDHDLRMKTNNMEFVWRASPSLGPDAQVFTGAFTGGLYGPPQTFCWDVSCNDEPLVEDQEEFIDYNVPQRVQDFLDQINHQVAYTKGTNLMVNFGFDFYYEFAREYFEQIDALIAAVTKDGRINVQYSTPSIYVEAKNKEAQQWQVKTDDFFPYSDGQHMYWTGYFVSRPALKRYVRTSSALLQTARQLEAFAGGDGSGALPLEKAVGVVQHHDAVAGTAMQHVAYDYAQRLSIASKKAESMMSNALSGFTTAGHAGATQTPFVFCELANISVCAATVEATGPVQITLWNSLARSRTELVSVPIASAQTIVLGKDGVTPVQAQVLHVYNVSSHRADSAQLSINFLASVPPFGFRTYFIAPAQTQEQVFHEEKHLTSSHRARAHAQKKASTWVSASVAAGPLSSSNADVIIENELVAVQISGTNGAVSSIKDKVTGATTPLAINYGFYPSYQADGQKSGAYIFRPAAQMLTRIDGTTAGQIDCDLEQTEIAVPQLIVQQGPIVQQVTFLISTFLNQTVRVVVGAGDASVAVEYTVGEIPIADGKGKEVVVQYQTGLASEGQWWSDSNAREMQPRVRNSRFSYNLSVDEPVAGNYVPINSAAYITDRKANLAFTVLNDRAQGVSSQADGELEVMVHRRLLMDDARGVGEPLNETDSMTSYAPNIPQPQQGQRIGRGLVITGTHYLLFSGNASQAARTWRPASQRVYAPFTPFFAAVPGTPAAYAASHVVQNSWAAAELPINVEAVTFSSWAQWTGAKQSVLVRVAHMFGLGEDAVLSQPVQVDLASIFPAGQTIVSITPMSLTATKPAADIAKQRLQWNTQSADNEMENQGDHLVDSTLQGTTVTLNTLEVQTFIVQLA